METRVQEGEAAEGPEPRPSLRERYEALRTEGVRLLAEERLAASRASFASALVVARALGDGQLLDRAVCNDAALAIAIDEEPPLSELRAILVRRTCSDTRALAAQQLARAYAQRKEYRKSLFYALVACRAADDGAPARRVAAEILLGNALLARCRFEDAAAAYRRALAATPEHQRDRVLTALANLGYCEVMRGELGRARQRLQGVVRRARAAGLRRIEAIAQIDLCLAHLDGGDLARARSHGERGLRLAEDVGQAQDWVKNALFLLGEVAVSAGRIEEGRRRFAELQRRFYPAQPALPDLLLGIGVRALVNLAA